MPPLYAICDQQWNLIRVANSPFGIETVLGPLPYANAALASVEDLRAYFVLVINPGTPPDQEWQTVVGNPSVVIDGDPEHPETMTATLQYTTQPISLEAAKAKLDRKVKDYKFRRMSAGVEVVIDGTAYVVQTDTASLARIDGVYELAKAGLLDEGEFVRMQDNRTPFLTPQQIIDLKLAISAMISECTKAQALREYAIDALPDDLQAHMDFDVTAGFPAFPATVTE